MEEEPQQVKEEDEETLVVVIGITPLDVLFMVILLCLALNSEEILRVFLITPYILMRKVKTKTNKFVLKILIRINLVINNQNQNLIERRKKSSRWTSVKPR